MAFLAPLAFLGLLLIIPILLLYMLRLRRREVMISSTFLWQQVVRDQEANTPWQRLRRNLLLILQLIILILMVFALARPFITVPAFSGGQTAVLIDASASMNADDQENELTRFEMAKTEALNILNTLGANHSMTVIRVGRVPEVLAPYTTDRFALRAAIESAQPGQSSADWLAALTLASAGGANVEDFTTVIISDGGLGDADNLPSISIPGEIRHVKVGESSENVALSALAVRSLPGQVPQLFGQISNYGNTPSEVILSLRIDGESVPAVSERYTIPANEDLPIVSTSLLDADFSVIQADITRSVNSVAQDHLEEDNTAWALSQGRIDRRVLMFTDGNLFLEQIFGSLPGIEAFRIDVGRPIPVQEFDLYIFDGVVPDELPDGDILIINPSISSSLYAVGNSIETVNDIVVNSDDDRMAFVDFQDVNILRYRNIQHTGWADELILADGNPLLFAGEVDGRQIAVTTFALADSDLPLQIAFPVLMSNLLEWFIPGNLLATGGTVSVGDSITLNPPLEADALRIVKPDGTQSEIPIERNTLIFTDTEQVGLYQVEVLSAGEAITDEVFAVNFFDASESQITPQDIMIGGEIVVSEISDELGQQEFWWLIILLALAFLFIEWYAYHRSLQVPTVFGGGQRRSGFRTVPSSS